MLTAIRAFAKSPWAVGLFVLLIFSFAVWGIRDVFQAKISNWVVQAGSREISANDFKRMFDNAKRQADEQSGQPMPIKDAVAAGFDRRVLEELSTDEAMAEFIKRLGVHPANSLIGDAISKQTAFFDPVTGKFDQKSYEQALAKNDLTPAKFEGYLRDELSQNHLAAGLAAGLKTPYAYGALIGGYELEGRNLSYFVLDQHSVPAVAQPTDQQLQAFLNQYGRKRPEMRAFTIVRFSAKQFGAQVTVDPAAVQKLFNFRKDASTQPEKRSLIAIPAKDMTAAQAIANRLKAGEAPDVVAKSVGAQPIAYTDVAKGGVADPKVADAAFSMKTGDVAAVQGALGVSVIKLGNITAPQTADFDKMKPALEAQVRADAAGQKAYDAVQKYEDAHGGGANVADAAKAAGVTAVSVGPISAEGQSLTPIPQGVLSQKALKDAFALPAGGESEVKDEGGGEYYTIHVDKVLPPAMPQLAEVRAEVLKAYIEHETEDRLQAKADALVAQINKGTTLEAAASSVGAHVQQIGGISREKLENNRGLGPMLAQRILAAKKGETIAAASAQGGVIVAHIDAVLPAPPGEAARTAAAGQAPLAKQLYQDAMRLAQQAAQNKVKPKTDLNRARLAIGLSPDDFPKDSPASSARPKAPGLAQ
jgi:peptidyl-prolyl cis-trans isomerase D